MIKVWSYLEEFNEEQAEIRAAIDQVLNSGVLILGDHVRQFEAEFSSWCGMEFGVGVNSGTDALFLALKAWGIGPGDEVVTVPNTAVPTVAAIAATGALPRFVDVEYESGLMNTEELPKVLTKNTKVILPVHLYGQCVDMHKVCSIARNAGIKVLEDCAQSHGARQHGQYAGSFGDLSAFSFYPTKILGGYGDGGMILAKSQDDEKKLRRLRFYGMEKTYYSLEHGYNSRLDELHAAILRSKLKHLDDYVKKRRKLAKRYDETLKNTALNLPRELPGNCHAYYLYVVRHSSRDRLMAHLKRKDIHVNISYPWPIHIMPAYRYLGYEEGDFPVAEKLAGEIFSIPMYPSLTDTAQETVIHAILEAL